MQFTTLYAAMSVAAVTSALPTVPRLNGTLSALNATTPEAVPFNSTVERRQAAGHATYYNTYYPTYSSCGMQPKDTDMIAALAPAFMPGACGKVIKVTNEVTGVSIDVTVVDTCQACAAGSVAIDLTPTAFTATGSDLGAGTFAASWVYA
jgi:hypothetical protein